MAGIKIKSKDLNQEDLSIYYLKDGKLVRRNEFKPIKDNEEMMALVSKLARYQRSEQQRMYMHEYYALINFLNQKDS